MTALAIARPRVAEEGDPRSQLDDALSVEGLIPAQGNAHQGNTECQGGRHAPETAVGDHDVGLVEHEVMGNEVGDRHVGGCPDPLCIPLAPGGHECPDLQLTEGLDDGPKQPLLMLVSGAEAHQNSRLVPRWESLHMVGPASAGHEEPKVAQGVGEVDDGGLEARGHH